MSQRKRPAFTADERTQLVGWLDMQRDIVRWKCEGVSDTDAHRAVLPASPNMTMAGLLSHMRWTEQMWFEVMLLDAPAVGPQFDESDEDADMKVDGVPLAQLLDEYERQCHRSNEIVAGLSLDDIGKNRKWPVGQASVRWVLLHMLEETARHLGHMDAIRELLDGGTGYY
ncbi:DinB family protein [Allokutzneria multivorans]|uniref:DinB family protein n=1 Tax=Allokutzneria multivorans TaxID=1142134 RepID=A0ABP7T2I9_9PSEU